ncbi:nucleoside deaminase [Candidatus Enterococcus mansonii]|uniref:CMP/dCMP-type deaminase domain-containing protein n=1 Tax=Candidatus Enterococcus mansonii TaxID=1834181 RepID=A0A242CJY6_9ENTE|nr:nucleoside deaminase [Enterococcus sp. 4G2_DIV0659]OTO10469.1 hypothetical protein A5880_001153 [Enterococcus sp. 4G2_DIV0659]
MNQHPNKAIMTSLIIQQWNNHSIYAAVIDEKMKIVSVGKTTVQNSCDPTAHAEVNAIREACAFLKTDSLPKGYWLYSTFEPCPLCASAAVWSKLDGIVYANDPRFKGNLPNWSFIKCKKVLEQGAYIHKVDLIENFMLDEIKDYFIKHK